MSIACCIFVFLLGMLSAASLSAQTAGSISGHVADPTGAVIPGATVTLTNVATDTVRTTVTTSAGDYHFFAVPPGAYNVSVSHSGFQTTTTPNVRVAVQQSLVLNFTLHVGAVAQTVTVAATNDLLNVGNVTLGTVVHNQALTQLPLNGRNYLSLVELAANTNTLSPTEGQAGSRLGGSRSNESISVGGQRIMFDQYTLDGINNTDVDFNTFVVQPTVDAIAQMKVQTGVYPAEFGYNATQINVVTKSGTNHYHGTGFEFIRNNYADGLGYDYAYPTPLPPVLPFKYNDWGFVVDGPISIPKLINGKNRFFFMANDEWYSSISVGQGVATLPTQQVMGGNFSQYTLKQGGSVIPIYDPATGNPDGTGRKQFECNGVLNEICPQRIDPVSAEALNLFYHPAQLSSLLDNYTYSNNSTETHNGFNLRIDYYQSSKSQWAFRFSNGDDLNNSVGFPAKAATVGNSIVTNFNQYMASNTWTISPTVVNVATFGYTSFYNALETYSAAKGVDPVAAVNIKGLVPGPQTNWGIPEWSFDDNYTGIGDTNDGPFVTNDPDTSINDNINWVRGKHSIDLGFQYDRQIFNELGNQFSRGVFNFQPNATAEVSSPGKLVPNTGDGFADFLLGDLYETTYAVSIAQANYVRNVEAAYFDDAYRVTPKLLLTMGVRYELTPPWYNTLGQEFVPDLNNSPYYPVGPQPASEQPFWVRQGECTNPYQGISVRWVDSSGNPVSPAPQCANGQFPNRLMETDYTNWAPRIGVSYSPTSTLVIRSGFGMYYDHDIANSRFDMARNLAGRVTQFSDNGTAGVPTINWTNAVASSGVATIPPPYTLAMQFNHKTEFTEEYLLDVQKQLGKNWSIDTGYMGTKSGNLWGFRDANWAIPYGYFGNGAPTSIAARTPYPNFGVIQLVHDLGVANYNAFSFKVTKQYSNGLNIVGSYTYSKSLDDTSGIRTQQSPLFPQNSDCVICDYGSSDFDVRHRFLTSVIYDLPVGQQPGALWKPSSKIVNAVIGGWQFSTIATFQSGTPFTPFTIFNLSDTDNCCYDRPNVVPGISQFEAHKTIGQIGQWLNKAAWTPNSAGFLGDMRRNVIFGPGFENFDSSLDKNFVMPYNEHHQLQIRFETFNTLNHNNPGNPFPIENLGALYGKVLGPQGLPSRELQLGAEYTF